MTMLIPLDGRKYTKLIISYIMLMRKTDEKSLLKEA